LSRDEDEARRTRRRLRACALAAGLFHAAFIWRSSFVVEGRRCFSLLDDAMISMRYARNLAAGSGLLWNPGEAPVEGYTNFLWTLVMGAFHLLPVSPEKVSLLVMLAGAVLLLLNLAVVARIARHVEGDASPAILVSVFLVATCYPLIFWTLRGMEVGLLCLLIDLAIVLAFRLHDRTSRADLLALTAVLSGAVLTRPDALVPAAVLMVFMAFVARRSGWRASYALVPVALLAVIAAHTAFRVRYYGDPLPNTYYLKMTGVPLLDRITRGATVMAELVAYHLWPVLLLLLGGVSVRARRLGRPKVLLLLGLFLAQVAYSIAVGGDAWEGTGFSNRYVTVALPALLVVVAGLLDSSVAEKGRMVVALLPALGIGLLLHSASYRATRPEAAVALASAGAAIGLAGGGLIGLHRAGRLRPAVRTAGAAALVSLTSGFFGVGCWLVKRNSGAMIVMDGEASRLGLLLARVTAPDATIAYVWAGAAPYFAGRRAVDLLGKNDPTIARTRPAGPFVPGHDRWSLAYSIGVLRPDLVVSLWEPTPSDEVAMARYGYTKLANGSYLRDATSGKVDVARWLRVLP